MFIGLWVGLSWVHAQGALDKEQPIVLFMIVTTTERVRKWNGNE